MLRVLASKWIAPLGPEVDAFEAELAAKVHAGGVAVLSSGTAALHLGLILLDVTRGDEVLVQSFTFAASANPIVYLGAEPIFIDSESDTWNMCPNHLREAINNRISAGKKPKACVIVHLYGMPAKFHELKAVCDEYQIPILEDAAESLGSRYFDEPTGSLSSIGVLSFNGNKIITTSGGGALTAQDPKLADRCRYLASQARQPAAHYEHTEIGYNYRLSNVLAALGRSQLSKLEKFTERRRKLFETYQEALGNISGINFLDEPAGFISNRWLSTFTIDTASSKLSSEEIQRKLGREQIESRPLWKPLHLQPIFKDCKYFGSDVAERLFRSGICLPSGSNLSIAEQSQVCEIILQLAQ